MPGLTGEELRFALWFLLAGFVSGFAVSTVWEWLYFRRERWSLDGADPFSLHPIPGAHAAMTRGAVLETEAAIQPPLRTVDSTGAPGFEVFEAPARSPVTLSPPEAFPSFLAKSPSLGGTQESSAASSVLLPSPPLALAQTVAPRSRGLPDDLTCIDGITPQIQQRLYMAGIFTWHQVATSDTDVLAHVARADAASVVEPWITRARDLAVEHGRQNASYSGPLPEDLTQIQGLTQSHARLLHRVGIVTFAQLAMTSPTELAALFDEEGQARADYSSWLRTARLLARTGGAEQLPATFDVVEVD